MLREEPNSMFDRDAFLKDPDNFLIDIPLEKSAGASDAEWLIQGVSSCEPTDDDGEELTQKGMDTSPLMQSGYINWDHRDKYGPQYLIGEPIEARLLKSSEFQHPRGEVIPGLSLFIKGRLYQNKEIARGVYEHLNTPTGPGRQMGWSVQGQILKRDPFNRSRVTRSVVYQMAITHQPKQRKTFAELVKSFNAEVSVMTTSSAAPLRLENLGREISQAFFDPCENGCITAWGEFPQGTRGALWHLAKCRGIDVEQSGELIENLARKWRVRF